jgi:kynurenine formamidase
MGKPSTEVEGRVMRKVLSVVCLVSLVAGAGFVAGAAATSRAPAPGGTDTSLPGFSHVVFLSHVNDPSVIPGFPGDPKFALTTAFTVAKDGFYLQYVKEGEHTGTHFSAPCHFHVHALCADKLSPGDFILPAVVVDIRAKVANNVNYQVTVKDLQDWVAVNGPMPPDAAVLLWTGCDRFWGPDQGPGVISYYTCGSGQGGFHQPGFSLAAVKWLIQQGVLGDRGLLGTDTFGPDPGSDPHFRETSLTLHQHRFTLENLTNLGALPTTGSWIVWGGPRNRNGSGAPSTVFGLIP